MSHRESSVDSCEEKEACQKCGKEVPDSPDPEEHPDDLQNRSALKNYDALECDLCEYWFHAKCLGLSFEKYKKVREVEDLMKWFCESCNAGFKKLKHQVTILENKVQQLESGMERAINDKITDIVMERMEREKRKKNLIFFGLPEADAEVEGSDRASFDKSSLRALRNVDTELEIKNENIELCFRVGKPERKKTRPLCVKFKDAAVKGRVLRGGKHLRGARGSLKSVFIAPDLTQTQRAERRKLVEELKDKREATNDDGWVIKFGKIVKRQTNLQPDRQQHAEEKATEKQAKGKKSKPPSSKPNTREKQQPAKPRTRKQRRQKNDDEAEENY